MMVRVGIRLEFHELGAIFSRVIEDEAINRPQCLLLDVRVGIREIRANDLLFAHKKKEQVALALKQLVKLIGRLAWSLGADYLDAVIVTEALDVFLEVALQLGLHFEVMDFFPVMPVCIKFKSIQLLGYALFEGYEFIEFVGIDGLVFAFFEAIALVAEKIEVFEDISNIATVFFQYIVNLIQLRSQFIFVDHFFYSLDLEPVLLEIELGEVEVPLVEVSIEAVLVVAEVRELAIYVLTVESQLKIVAGAQFLAFEVGLAANNLRLCLDAVRPIQWQHRCPMISLQSMVVGWSQRQIIYKNQSKNVKIRSLKQRCAFDKVQRRSTMSGSRAYSALGEGNGLAVGAFQVWQLEKVEDFLAGIPALVGCRGQHLRGNKGWLD